MKSGFNLSVIGLLAVVACAIYQNTAGDSNYSARLASIAIQVNAMNVGWKAGNPLRFQNLDKASIKAIMGTYFEETPSLPDVTEFNTFTLEAPASFDSRQQWPNCKSIPEIRDQANCGSCWAFGAAEALSDRICIGSNANLQTRISTTDLVTCCSSCGNGCNGGQLGPTWNWMVRTGVVTGDLYGDNTMCQPYFLPPCAHHTTNTTYPPCGASTNTPSCNKKCNSAYPTAYSSDKKFAKNAYSVIGASNMVNEISTNGPIEVAFSVYEDFLTYTSGVYRHTTGNFLGGHAVRAIGYGTENGTPYWLIANSWNETWGDQGYFKIIKGVNECGIESQGTAGMAAV
jgi:cathepsin B